MQSLQHNSWHVVCLSAGGSSYWSRVIDWISSVLDDVISRHLARNTSAERCSPCRCLVFFTVTCVSFYQRGSVASYASADIATAEMSVCHTVVSYQNDGEPEDYFANIRFIPKFQRSHPERGRFMRLYIWGVNELAIFDLSHTRFRLVPKSTTSVDPELTLKLNDPYCTRVFGAHHKKWMKIDPYYQRQKCSPEIL